jgi:hypothetical protein
LTEVGRAVEAVEVYEALVASGDLPTRCASWGKLVALRARIGPPQALAQAVAGALAAARESRSPIGRATALLGVLLHGGDADAASALGLLRPATFEPDLAARLRQAITGRGLVAPFPIDSL